MEVNIDLVTQLERLTKQGDSRKVLEIIDNLVLKKIPRNLAAPLAQICFRNSLYLQSIKILNPIVCSTIQISPSPHPNEIIAYSSALVSLNMNREAQNLLKQIDTDAYPEALLIRAFSYFGEWNYEKPIPLLKKFCTNPRVSSYRQIVGKVNLAAAYTTTSRQTEAENLLNELLQITKDKKYRLLQGNTLELLAQLEIQKKNYKKALDFINEAKNVLPDSHSIYFFFLKKWECICLLLLTPDSLNALQMCEKIKSESIDRGHWETARDIDLYISFATHNINLLQKILQGTPNPLYLKKIEILFGRKISFDQKFTLKSDQSQTNIQSSVYFEEIISDFKTNKYQVQLFYLLTRDFYRPANFGYLFSKLYPNERFNPLTSEKRILNQIYGLSQSLNAKKHFCEIHKKKMDFIFKLAPDTELILSRNLHQKPWCTTLKNQLRYFGSKVFTAQDLAAQLRCSKRKAQVILKGLLSQKYITCTNKGPKTAYVLSNYIHQNLETIP